MYISGSLSLHVYMTLYLSLFQSAWHGDTPALPVFNDGENIIPCIHIRDLASVVVSLVEFRPAKPRYLLAVDDSKNSLKEVVSAISRQLTTGRVSLITKEEALLIKDLTVRWLYIYK